jgi:hypothetical protein
MIALTELGQSAYNSGVGIPIPKRRPSCCYTPLTPSSPTSGPSYHPYSSQSPSVRVPEPQCKIWPASNTRRRLKPLRSSAAPQANKPVPTRRHQSEATAAFLSPPLGVRSRPGSFIDASSYECIPDSPAKHVISSLSQAWLTVIVASRVHPDHNPNPCPRRRRTGDWSVPHWTTNRRWWFQRGKGGLYSSKRATTAACCEDCAQEYHI